APALMTSELMVLVEVGAVIAPPKVAAPLEVTRKFEPALMRLVRLAIVPVNSIPLTVPTAAPEAERFTKSEVLPVLAAGVWLMVKPEAVLPAAAPEAFWKVRLSRLPVVRAVSERAT